MQTAPEGSPLLTSIASSLDDVDLGRHIARHFQADGLLANLRLVPSLHEFPPSWKGALRRSLPEIWGCLLFTTNHVSVFCSDQPALIPSHGPASRLHRAIMYPRPKA